MPQGNYLLSPIIPFFSAGGNGGSDVVGTETGEKSGGLFFSLAIFDHRICLWIVGHHKSMLTMIGTI